MREDMLYSVALQCAEMCDGGCEANCENCQFNVFNYVKDVREASLLKANAYTDFYRSKQHAQQAKDRENGGVLAMLILIGLVIWGFMSVGSCVSDFFTSRKARTATLEHVGPLPTEVVTAKDLKKATDCLRECPDMPESIELILLIMPYVVKDINGSGTIDCIDYSVVFRYYYGPSCRIIINNNPINGFNHMFVHAGDMYIEPQGTPERYTMGAVWGMRYDPRYNKYVTDIWGGKTLSQGGRI